MNNSQQEVKETKNIVFDREKIREIIRLSGRQFKIKEVNGKTKAQTIGDIVEGIEKVLKNGN